MNRELIRQAIRLSLKQVAPEVDASSLALDADLREEIDLDSMDILNFARALHTQLGIEIAERDYAKLSSLAAAEEYLASKLP